jgi:hypothetical protein
MILSYNFNIPKKDFMNNGSAGADFNLTSADHVMSDTTSAMPAKDRGLWFDRTLAGFVKLPNFTLHATFSIHFWVLIKSKAPASDKLNTIFSKDRGYASGAETENNFLLIAIDDSEKIVLQIAGYQAPYTVSTCQSTALVKDDAGWKYVVVSATMKEGKRTEVIFFVDNTPEAVQTMANYMLVDEPGFDTFLGAKGSATNTTFSDKLNGYLYDFHVYQAAHTDATTTHASTCTGGKCSTLDYNQYEGGNTCTIGCLSCVRAGSC